MAFFFFFYDRTFAIMDQFRGVVSSALSCGIKRAKMPEVSIKATGRKSTTVDTSAWVPVRGTG